MIRLESLLQVEPFVVGYSTENPFCLEAFKLTVMATLEKHLFTDKKLCLKIAVGVKALIQVSSLRSS